MIYKEQRVHFFRMNKERRINLMINKKAQVWIETVLYTLIGLALIALVLTFATPKINELKDRSLVNQAINSLNSLDEKMTDALQSGTGNVREVDFSMKSGELYIDGISDKIIFVLSGLTKPYSEIGVPITQGRITILSIQGPKTSTVNLTIQYNANITYNEIDEAKKFNAAPTPYKFVIENKGVLNEKEIIDIRESTSS